MLLDCLILIITAVVTAWVAGFFAIGGGLILVPVFSWLLPTLGAGSATMHSAIATSLVLIIPSSISSLRQHHLLGRFDLQFFRSWGVHVAIGVIIGALLANQLRGKTLGLIFSFFLAFCFILQWMRRNNDEEVPEAPKHLSAKLAAIFIGGSSTLLGVGGGVFTHIVLGHWRYPIKSSLAIAAGGGLIIGIGGALLNIFTGLHAAGRAPYSLGYIYLPAVIIMAPILAWVAPMGAKMAHRCPTKVLKKIYQFFLLTMTILSIIKWI